MSDTLSDDQQLKRTAALIASRPGVVDHVRRTGRLPADIPTGGAHIGIRLLIESRGWDIELRPDEQLVYDALVLDRDQHNKTVGSQIGEENKQSATGKVPCPSSYDLIYGNRPTGELVFIERSKALENIAFNVAKTWGDFRKGAPGLYERAIHDLDVEGVEGTVPPDDSELDHDKLSGDGDFLYFPEQLMLDFIPTHVSERFGTIVETVHNGPMLLLNCDHESKIVAALCSAGFSVQRDDALINALYT